MLFNSFEFALFFALVLAVYASLSHRAQNRWLLVASYVFYGAWDWRFLGLILLSTAVDYVVALRLAATEGERGRRMLLGVSLAVNLGVLGFFKYADFFADSLARLAGAFGLTLQPLTLHVILPVGISFYTFQTLSYTFDIYRRQLEPTRDFLDFALFVAFFPQLVAGPIERAQSLLPQITRPRTMSWEGIPAGSWLVLWGLFKKVVISDNIVALVDAVYSPGSDPTSAEVLLGTYAFAVQIYCDFSGYTDIARGVARMLGFDLMLNFRLPYFARNPSEFWRRWHISLSTWLRDYLYIPLGGSRHGKWQTYRNLMLTMVLGGLWHGAAWNFVFWGAYHGGLLAFYRAARDRLGRLVPRSGPGLWAWKVGAVVFTFHLVCLGWVLFRVESMAQAGDLLGRLAGPWEVGMAGQWILPMLVLVGPLLVVQLVQALSGDLEFVRTLPLPARSVVYVLLVGTILVFGEDFGQPFIYFQF